MNEGFADFFPVALNDDRQFNWDALIYRSLEDAVPALRNKTHAEAVGTEGNVAMALFDLYDAENESAPLEVGDDFYTGGLQQVLDVFANRAVGSSVFSFWEQWRLSGNPKHFSVRALRLNQIDFNTPPVWSSAIPNYMLDPFEELIIDTQLRIHDPESSDTELRVTVNSTINPEVVV